METRENDFVEGVLRVEMVHAEELYEVWVVKFDDMPTTTYGIVNKNTGVIENIQPNLANAKTLAKQFGEWLKDESNNAAMLRIVSQSIN